MNFTEITRFWFEEIEKVMWFKKDTDFDKALEDRFLTVHRQASACELSEWRNDPLGTLAEIIILDQFSRNIFRDTPKAFAQDPLALALAQEAVRRGDDQKLPAKQRNFIYMPYMHSESAVVHEAAVELFRVNSFDDIYDYELKHKAIIDRFGRYPHRNEILGRKSTPEEIEFLKQPNSSF